MFLAAVAALLATGRAEATELSVPVWAYAVVAVLAMAPAAAVLPKMVGDAVHLAAPIFDHAKVALIDDMMKFGVPPGNPFFGDAYPRLAYYYLWHFGAAEVALATGISGWEADIAMTWFAGFASLAMMMGVAAWLGGRGAAILVAVISMAASARMVLWWIFGAQNAELAVGRAAGFGGWLFQAAWVPQHIMSGACAVAAVVLMAALAQRRSALLVATLALVVAAGFESSTWIGGVTFAVAGPVTALVVLLRVEPRRRGPFIAALAVAAGVAACLAAPLLRDQLAATAGRGSPIALQLYPVLGAYFSDALRAILDPPSYWLVLLPIELPAVYVIGMMALMPLIPRRVVRDRSTSSWPGLSRPSTTLILRGIIGVDGRDKPGHDESGMMLPGISSSHKLDDDRKRVASALAVLTVAGLMVCWLLASTLAENDDLGWRAILPAAMALTALAAAALSRWIATRARLAVVAAGVAIIMGLPGGIDLIRSYVTGQVGVEIAPAARLFAASPDMWAAVRRHAGVGERVGNNPLFMGEMTPWPVNISWALLADRRSCYAGRELALVYTTLGPRRTDEVDAQFIRVFTGDGTPADVQALATGYDCRVIVVTATDGAWGRDPFAASPLYRLVDEKAQQWRIYRATAGE